MAIKTFTLGPDLRYEAAERVRYNGVNGIVWILRVRAQGGWMHTGKQFMPLTATRQQVVERFGQIYRPQEVAA
jgi:hypothetical protein